jgi:hypothetical protein
MIYSDLQDRVASYLDRSDLTTKIQGWIDDARKDLALKWPFKYLYVESTTSTVANQATYALPDDYLGHLNVWCGSKKLVRLSTQEADNLAVTDIDASAIVRNLTFESGTTVSIADAAGAPDYYIDKGMEFDLYPTPDAAYTLTIKYYAQPTTFVSGSEYDYISTFHFEAIIWGAALRGAMFLDDKEKLTSFGQAYDSAIQEMVQREKMFEKQDQVFRLRDWRDFDLTTFKRMQKISLT